MRKNLTDSVGAVLMGFSGCHNPVVRAVDIPVSYIFPHSLAVPSGCVAYGLVVSFEGIVLIAVSCSVLVPLI